MTNDPTSPVVEALPERALLFHIGPPKTGTTSLQAAAAATMDELLAHGVHYLADNPRRAVSAFMDRGFGWQTEDGTRATRPPSQRHWKAMIREIEDERERRIWLSQEFVARSDESWARRWHEALGPRTHVVLTLRAFSTMVPSIWQQSLKAVAGREPFDRWLKRAFTPGTEANRKLVAKHDHAELVARWARVVGTENVTIVVLDPGDHSFVPHAFEDLLGLPRDLLAGADIGAGGVLNRSLSTAEIELIRQLNIGCREHGMDWPDYERLVLRGGVARMLVERSPGHLEGRLGLPQWAAERAHEEEERFRASIAASGVRVVGDLDRLVVPIRVRSGDLEDHRGQELVPISAAVEAMLGILAAATGRDPAFEQTTTSVYAKVRADARTDLAALTAEPRRRLRRFWPGGGGR